MLIDVSYFISDSDPVTRDGSFMPGPAMNDRFLGMVPAI
jgi:hypothetical protein